MLCEIGFGAVGGDFVAPVVTGGVEGLADIDRLRPVGPAAVAQPGGHVEVHLPQRAVAFGAEIEGVHVGVEQGRALVERGVDGRSQLEGLTPAAVAVEEGGIDIDRGVGFAVSAAGGCP